MAGQYPGQDTPGYLRQAANTDGGPTSDCRSGAYLRHLTSNKGTNWIGAGGARVHRVSATPGTSQCHVQSRIRHLKSGPSMEVMRADNVWAIFSRPALEHLSFCTSMVRNFIIQEDLFFRSYFPVEAQWRERPSSCRTQNTCHSSYNALIRL